MLPRRRPDPLDTRPDLAANFMADAVAQHLDLSEFLLTPERFVLRMQGDSMLEAVLLATRVQVQGVMVGQMRSYR